jgi:tRNA(Ser,Leu) C12 N-acetylase TAN1
MSTLTDRIQSAIDAVLFAVHEAERAQDQAQDEAQGTEMAFIYTRLDDAFKELKSIKNTAERLARNNS